MCNVENSFLLEGSSMILMMIVTKTTPVMICVTVRWSIGVLACGILSFEGKVTIVSQCRVKLSRVLFFFSRCNTMLDPRNVVTWLCVCFLTRSPYVCVCRYKRPLSMQYAVNSHPWEASHWLLSYTMWYFILSPNWSVIMQKKNVHGFQQFTFTDTKCHAISSFHRKKTIIHNTTHIHI